MKNIVKLALAASALGLASVAQAGFVNGGFEDGTFNGWTVELGYHEGTNTVFGAGPYAGFGPYIGDAQVIGAVADPYSPFDSPFNGSKMARLNSNDFGNYGAARISQTGVMGVGETDIFINWGSVLNDPGHDSGEQPYFLISVLLNGNPFASEFHTAGQAGWTASADGYSYSSGVFHVGGLNLGDTITVMMTVADCGLGGHDGWAYLDGIGTTQQTPPPGVPDSGLTGLLLIPALCGLVAVRRRK